MDPRAFLQPASADTPASSEGFDAQARVEYPQGAAGSPGVPYEQGQDQPAEQESEADRRARELEERLQTVQAQNQQFQQTFDRVRQYAEQTERQQREQQVNQRFNVERERIMQTARNMGVDEGMEYISRQMSDLNNQALALRQETAQEYEQRMQQMQRVAFTPLFAQELVRQHGLPAEYEQKLMRFGDVDRMPQYVEDLKSEYQERQQLQQQIDQLARTQQANNLVRQGAGMAGGSNAPANANLSLEGMDTDDRAATIYLALKNGTYGR